MFELNQAIASWRASLQEGAGLNAAAADELEQHLLDSLPGFQELGLSEEEAFLLATHRVGQPDVLAPEYAKVSAAGLWRKRLPWMAAGVLCLLFVQTAAAAARSLGWGVAVWSGGGGAEMSWAGIAAEASIWLAAFAGLAAVLLRGAPLPSRVPGLAIAAAAMIGLALFRVTLMASLVQTVPAEHFGAAAQASATTNLLEGVGVPLACIALLLCLRPSSPTATVQT